MFLLPTELQKVVEAYAANGMVATKTGRALFMSHTAVRHRLNKVKNITGLNPYNFHDLAKLCGYGGEE